MTDMPATDIPAGAERSNDGQWWWDGSQWQPVHAAGSGTATQPAQAASTPAQSETAGQLSDDGQWRWDGTQWQPAHAATGAGSPAETAAGSTGTHDGRRITLGVPTAAARVTHDGTSEVIISYSVTNTGTTPLEANALLMTFLVIVADRTAEITASVTGHLPVALAVGEEHRGDTTLQVDPGSRTVSVSVDDAATGESLATSDPVAVEVPGHRVTTQAFDDTQAYTLTLSINSVEHVADTLYRVHYDIDSDRDVPAGLYVDGRITSSEGISSETYVLTTDIAAGRPHAHYLTMEAASPSHSTAFIVVDPGGPSEKSESAVVEISEDGTPTMSR
jgi:hypothetical protein